MERCGLNADHPVNPLMALTRIAEYAVVPRTICQPDDSFAGVRAKFAAVPGTILYLIVRVWVRVRPLRLDLQHSFWRVCTRKERQVDRGSAGA